MEISRLASILNDKIKEYIDEVAPTIKNSNLGYLIEKDDKVYIYNLEVAEAEEFPVYKCVGGETPPTEGCGKLFSDQSVANQFSFRRKYPEGAREVLRILEKKEALDNRPIGKDRIIEETDQGYQSASQWLNYLESHEVIEHTQRGYTFHKENMKPMVCPHCGGTDFDEINSMEEWRERV